MQKKRNRRCHKAHFHMSHRVEARWPVGLVKGQCQGPRSRRVCCRWFGCTVHRRSSRALLQEGRATDAAPTEHREEASAETGAKAVHFRSLLDSIFLEIILLSLFLSHLLGEGFNSELHLCLAQNPQHFKIRSVGCGL